MNLQRATSARHQPECTAWEAGGSVAAAAAAHIRETSLQSAGQRVGDVPAGSFTRPPTSVIGAASSHVAPTGERPGGERSLKWWHDRVSRRPRWLRCHHPVQSPPDACETMWTVVERETPRPRSCWRTDGAWPARLDYCQGEPSPSSWISWRPRLRQSNWSSSTAGRSRTSSLVRLSCTPSSTPVTALIGMATRFSPHR